MTDTRYDEDIHITRSTFIAHSTPWIVTFIILNYFSTPLQRFADPFLLWASGVLAAIGIGMITLAALRFEYRKPLLIYTGAAFLTLSLVPFGFTVSLASDASERTGIQCRALEVDMEKLHPQRADGRELFQALGCHPQGVGTLVFPKHR